MNQPNQFVTINKLDNEYWIVKARVEKASIIIEEKLEPIELVRRSSKIARKIAKKINLPYIKINSIEEGKKVQQRFLKKIKREARLKKQEQQRQNNLKQQWLQWVVKFEDNEQLALVGGLWACEQLARDLACQIRSQSEDYYLIVESQQNKDLMRLVQFNELKNLWLKRNRDNIIAVKKLPFVRPPRIYQFAFSEFYEETFFSYFETTQLYLYEVKVERKQYSFFSDLEVADSARLEEVEQYYAKQLSSGNKQKIGQSFGSLVPIIEWGGRRFWQRYWSKKNNRLLI